MSKICFYTVTCKVKNSEAEDSFVLTRSELILFLRKGCKFTSIRLLERPDFSNPELFEQENDDDIPV